METLIGEGPQLSAYQDIKIQTHGPISTRVIRKKLQKLREFNVR
jgi:hypothetical protein